MGKDGDMSSDFRIFAGRAIRNFGTVGAMAPTSEAAARVMAALVPRTGKPVVLEVGPGTGALSGPIRRRLPTGARHLGVELDPGMVAHLRETKPWLELIEGDARELTKLLADAGVDKVDAVISGLPWTVFSAEQQQDILEQISQVMAPDGIFTTLAYLPGLPMPAGIQLRRNLHSVFDEVRLSRVFWRNFPPTKFYLCRKPIVRD